ncbi:hypothetical protein XENOCAPTIV_022539 [Xenoophorus captivus]|uniref:Uncharacterized protein n=1 Tax=Xenoophorus captivus TaxID=1517983 RepID=A0ABV0RII7_9TELE
MNYFLDILIRHKRLSIWGTFHVTQCNWSGFSFAKEFIYQCLSLMTLHIAPKLVRTLLLGKNLKSHLQVSPSPHLPPVLGQSRAGASGTYGGPSGSLGGSTLPVL